MTGRLRDESLGGKVPAAMKGKTLNETECDGTCL